MDASVQYQGDFDKVFENREQNRVQCSLREEA